MANYAKVAIYKIIVWWFTVLDHYNRDTIAFLFGLIVLLWAILFSLLIVPLCIKSEPAK